MCVFLQNIFIFAKNMSKWALFLVFWKFVIL